ncbi:MAG: serine hydrolase domain-containing protein [Lutibacter sp.]|nr:serine hydrolase [Lutibacter sp.]MDT8416488.1 serine hydrolase domain-containing protein [Lutibacter sp.]
MNKPYIIYVLLFASMFFFVVTNRADRDSQINRLNNDGDLYNSNDLALNHNSKNDLNEFILKEAYKVPIEKIQNYTSQLSRQYGFNGSILIAKNGKILFEEHIGRKDLRLKDPIDSTSIYQLASVSKQFTAAAILLLYQEGKLDIDDFASKYLTDFPYQNIKIRHLLNHTSGLPNYMYAAENKWKSKTPPDNIAMLGLMNKLKMQVYFKPGDRFHYSNTGYFILASIVSKVSNQSFSNFLDSRFFKPLNLTNTYVHNPNEASKKEELMGFRRYGKSYTAIPFTVNDGVVGDKGIYSTASDLFKWNQSLTERTILKDTILSKAFLPGKTNNGKIVPYGFGFRLKQETDMELVYHNGVWNGFSTTLRRYNADDITIIILSNNSFNSITPISEKLHELSNEFSKYDPFVSFLENTNIYDINKLEDDLVNFADIPRVESVAIIEKIANIYNKQNTRFVPHKYSEVSNPILVNQQYQVLLN